MLAGERSELRQVRTPECNEAHGDASPRALVRESGIEVGDRNKGLLSRIENTPDGGYDLPKLTEYLTQVKQQFPDKTDATLLLEPEVKYDSMVAVMDKMRVAEQLDTTNNRVLRTELFPEISVGDATAKVQR